LRTRGEEQTSLSHLKRSRKPKKKEKEKEKKKKKKIAQELSMEQTR